MPLELLTYKPKTSTVKPTPLLFIHGAWHGAWCWEKFWLPYFAQQGYVCYALSLRGHGGSHSQVPIWHHGIDDYIADVKTIADQIMQEQGCYPVLIGHSLGGFIVQKYLEKYVAPGGVLLASIPHVGAIRYFLRTSFKYPRNLLKSIFSLSLIHFVNTPEMSRSHFFSPDMAQADVEHYTRQVADESWHMVLDVLLLKLPRPAKINVPLFVLGAENDAVFFQSEIRSLARAYGSSASFVPKCAHDIMLDSQWQVGADQILAWLNVLEEKQPAPIVFPDAEKIPSFSLVPDEVMN